MQQGLQGSESVFWKSRFMPFPIVINSTSLKEEKDSNPGEGNKGKGKSCRGREKVKWLGHFLSPHLVSRWIWWKNPAVGNKVGCALKTRVRAYPPPSGSVCSVRLLAFLLAAFLGFGGIFVLVLFLFWFWSHRAENIVCTHHGTDIQINSTGCFSLHYSCELSSELSSSQVGCACYISVCLYFIQFFFNGGKINLTVVLNQKYPFPSYSSPRENSRSHGCLCLPIYSQLFFFFFFFSDLKL